VRLRLTQSNGVWQPTELFFFQFETEKKSAKRVPALSVRFGPIQRQFINDDLFEIDVDEANTIDQTEPYSRRIDILTGKRRVAEEHGDSIR